MAQELLKLENLSVDYRVRGGYLSAVRNVSLAIGRGEIMALVGESGCGKSTVAHTVMRLLMSGNERVTGKILLDGEDISHAGERRLEALRGKRMGMIFQNPLDSLNPVYRTGSQVAEAMLLDVKDRRAVWEGVVRLYKDVRMPDAEKRALSFPHELSGGMRQRVMIAMMLSRNPELLIADEPTTALDVTIEAQILEIIKDLRDSHGASILLITHNFGLVAEVADRIGVMYAGEIVEQGDVFSVFDDPVHPYTKLLMRALPKTTKDEGRLQVIEGTVPRILGAKPGCRFANRCPIAQGICTDTDPPEREAGRGHTYRCHLTEEAKTI